MYTNVSASDSCGLVGKTYSAITLSYAPGELSTLRFPPNVTDMILGLSCSAYLFNFADLRTTCGTNRYSVSAPDISCFLTHNPAKPISQLDSACQSRYSQYLASQTNKAAACNPCLDFPLKLRTHDPAWASCEAQIPLGCRGAYDPPSALGVAAALVAPTPRIKKARGTHSGDKTKLPSTVAVLQQPLISRTSATLDALHVA